MPRQETSRSKLLTQVTSVTDHEEEIPLTVPKGVLQTWMLSCALLSLKSSASLSPELAAYDPQLPAYIKVHNCVVLEWLYHAYGVGSMLWANTDT